jgi:hypothetical protein
MQCLVGERKPNAWGGMSLPLPFDSTLNCALSMYFSNLNAVDQCSIGTGVEGDLPRLFRLLKLSVTIGGGK